MLNFLPGPILGIFSLLLYVINTVSLVGIVMVAALFKLIISAKGWRRFWTKVIILISDTWIRINKLITRFCFNIEWDVDESLNNHSAVKQQITLNGWYLVVCNHQSWVDIITLQTIFTGKIPFLKFFLKKELIWVPFLGLAWWALDFPFMKRYSKAFLEKNPHLKGKDIESTRKACEKFQYTPVSVMNFLEGTRFTNEKSQQQNSPYKRLLKPKAGGIAFVLSAMDGKIDTMVDTTIQYHDKDFGAWDFLCGKITKITVRVKTRKIPANILAGDYEEDPQFREEFQQWVSGVWQEKDDLLSQLHQAD